MRPAARVVRRGAGECFRSVGVKYLVGEPQAVSYPVREWETKRRLDPSVIGQGCRQG